MKELWLIGFLNAWCMVLLPRKRTKARSGMRLGPQSVNEEKNRCDLKEVTIYRYQSLFAALSEGLEELASTGDTS
jgi:hypothetical protein